MGCAISKWHTRIIDSNKLSSSLLDVRTVDTTTDLNAYFNVDNPNAKCIFIFGKSC